MNFRAAIVPRLFFGRLCRHLIARDPHVIHFLVGASHVMGVAWRYRQFVASRTAHPHAAVVTRHGRRACAFTLPGQSPAQCRHFFTIQSALNNLNCIYDPVRLFSKKIFYYLLYLYNPLMSSINV